MVRLTRGRGGVLGIGVPINTARNGLESPRLHASTATSDERDLSNTLRCSRLTHQVLRSLDHG